MSGNEGTERSGERPEREETAASGQGGQTDKQAEGESQESSSLLPSGNAIPSGSHEPEEPAKTSAA